MATQPKTLIYDIETAPAIGLFFGRPYEVNIAKTIQHEYVFGFAYQWLDKKQIPTCYIWDFPEFYKPLRPKTMNLEGFLEAYDERIRSLSMKVLARWSELVNDSQVVVGHNSDSFDYKQMHGRIMQYKLPPIGRPKFVDTKKIAKRLGAYDSNKLDDLSKRFGHGGKMQHDGIEMWWDCMNGKPKAMKHIVAYNKVDVQKTTLLYLDFRPYDDNHPNMSLLTGQPDACKHCGKNEGFVGNGFDYTRTGKYRRFQCKNCRGNNRSRTAEKEEKPRYV